MPGNGDGTTDNTISGGMQYGPVLQGQNFRDVRIGVSRRRRRR